MDISVAKKKDARIVVTVSITAEERKDAESKALQSIAEHVKVKGFRPGKAPESTVRERVSAEDLLEETVRALLPKIFKEALEKSGAKPVLRPSVNIESKEPLTLSLVFVEKPDVTLKKPESISVEKKGVTVTDEEVESFVKKILSQDKTEKEVERAAEKGDSVEASLVTTDTDGKNVKELTVEKYTFTLGEEELLQELEEPVTGMKKGEKKSVKLHFKKDHEIPSLQGKKLTVEITVKRIAEMTLPNLTDAYLKDKLKIEKTPDAFRGDIRTMLQSQKLDGEMKRREEELYEAVKKATIVTIPQELIDAEAQDILSDFAGRLKEKGTTLEDWMKQTKKEPKDLLKEMQDISTSRSTLRLGMQELAKHKKIEPAPALLSESVKKTKGSMMKKGGDVREEDFEPGGNVYENIFFDLTMRTLVESMIGNEERK